jgi:hypothetical protein
LARSFFAAMRAHTLRQKWQPRRHNARRNLALSNLETPDIFLVNTGRVTSGLHTENSCKFD